MNRFTKLFRSVLGCNPFILRRKFSSSSSSSDPLLFCAGPVSTSRRVKNAALVDVSHKDSSFFDCVADVKKRLLNLTGIHGINQDYECILVSGGGTAALESVISSTISSTGKLLVLRNGAYGRRISTIARIHKIETEELTWPEDSPMITAQIIDKLSNDFQITDVTMVHCERSSGLIQPVSEVGKLVKETCASRRFVVDAESTFGVVPVGSTISSGTEFIVGSSGLGLQGLPGLGFVLAEKAALISSINHARTLALNIHDVWMPKNGQITGYQPKLIPPVQLVYAFREALKELEDETLEGRMQRYRENYTTLIQGMTGMGFRLYLPSQLMSTYALATFFYPPSTNFVFDTFYKKLKERGFIINSGELSTANTFQIGAIGNINRHDMKRMVDAVMTTKKEMNF